MSSNGLYNNEPRPRLCHLRRWEHFSGYGFNLHCEKSKPGQYIGKVDPNSPAESAGLRENDRIIEVNFAPIGTENHKQVVARIKEGVTRGGTTYPEEVILLVVDEETDEYYKDRSYEVTSTGTNVLKLETEIRHGSENGSDSPETYNRNTKNNGSYHRKETPPQTNREYMNSYESSRPTGTRPNKNSSSPTISRTSDQSSEPPEEQEPYPRSSFPSSVKNSQKEHSSSNTYTNVNSSAEDYHPRPSGNHSLSSANGSKAGGDVLDTHMSAAEYREKLKAQNARKRDPRQTQKMSMQQKHDVIDSL